MRRERRIIRLREYDYRQSGAYAVTICAHERRFVFGRIEEGIMRLHPFGQIARDDWLNLDSHYSNLFLDEWVVMPNHIHGILFIENEAIAPEDSEELRQFGQPVCLSLSSMIGNYKSGVTRKIGELRGAQTCVWQPRFYEHIIRNDRDLELQRQYIRNNPSKWADDELNTP